MKVNTLAAIIWAACLAVLGSLDATDVVANAAESSENMNGVDETNALSVVQRSKAALAAVISENYNVNEGLSDEIARHALTQADELGLDPLLILAVIAQESSFNPKAVSHQDLGLMQVNSYWHRDKIAKVGEHRVFEPQINIQLGTAILKEYCIKTGGDCFSEQGQLKLLRRYNGVKVNKYPEEVMAKKNRIEGIFKEKYASL